MACCHDAEASPVSATCRAFSPNSFHKNSIVDSQSGTEEKTPSEELPHCSRKETTYS